MNPVYVDVGAYMQVNFRFSDGSGLTPGDNFAGGEWIQNDSQVLLLDGIGTPSELKDLYEQVNLQVLVRGNRNEHDRFVYVRAYEIMRFLLNLPESVEMNGCIYKGFEQDSALLQLGKDENERFVYSFNLFTFRGV